MKKKLTPIKGNTPTTKWACFAAIFLMIGLSIPDGWKWIVYVIALVAILIYIKRR